MTKYPHYIKEAFIAKIFNGGKCMSINKKLIISFFIILLYQVIIGGVSLIKLPKQMLNIKMTAKAKENISILNTVISQI